MATYEVTLVGTWHRPHTTDMDVGIAKRVLRLHGFRNIKLKREESDWATDNGTFELETEVHTARTQDEALKAASQKLRRTITPRLCGRITFKVL